MGALVSKKHPASSAAVERVYWPRRIGSIVPRSHVTRGEARGNGSGGGRVVAVERESDGKGRRHPPRRRQRAPRPRDHIITIINITSTAAGCAKQLMRVPHPPYPESTPFSCG